jgi:hypothetical protein
MIYADEMGFDAMIYIPSFIEIGSGIHKLMGRIYMQTHRTQDGPVMLLSFFFFKNKESWLK